MTMKNMKKVSAKNFFTVRNWLVLAMLLTVFPISAQNSASQTDLKEFERVDICTRNPKYAIVTKDGKKGIYDMLLHQNVVPAQFREVFFSRQDVEDSLYYSIFFAKEGIKVGILSVDEETNFVMSIWLDDPDEVLSLDECTTIDQEMTKRVGKQLKRFIKKQKLENAQIVIMNSQTGHLKTWIALEQDMKKEDAGKLLTHSCTSSVTKPFHVVMALEKEQLTLDSICDGITYRQAIKTFNNPMMRRAIFGGYRRSAAERKWEEQTNTQRRSTNPLNMAVGYNSVGIGGRMICPTLRGDSVETEDHVLPPSILAALKDVLRVDRKESPQLAWLTDAVDWLGYATTEYIYAEEDRELKTPIGRELQFIGVFPAENPKYTICIVADKKSLDIEPSVFQDVVNPLSQWLLKR